MYLDSEHDGEGGQGEECAERQERCLAPRPGIWGSGFRVQGSGFRVQGSEFRVWGSGLRVEGLGFGIWD